MVGFSLRVLANSLRGPPPFFVLSVSPDHFGRELFGGCGFQVDLSVSQASSDSACNLNLPHSLASAFIIESEGKQEPDFSEDQAKSNILEWR